MISERNDWNGVLVVCVTAAIVMSIAATSYVSRTRRVVESEWRAALQVTARAAAPRLAAWKQQHMRETAVAATMIATARDRAATLRLVNAARASLPGSDVALLGADGQLIPQGSQLLNGIPRNLMPTGRLNVSEHFVLEKTRPNDVSVITIAPAGTSGLLFRRTSLRESVREFLPRPPRDVHQREFLSARAAAVMASGPSIFFVPARDDDSVIMVATDRAPMTWRSAVQGETRLDKSPEGVELVAVVGAADGVGAIVSVAGWEALSGLPSTRVKGLLIAVAVFLSVAAMSVTVRHARLVSRRRVAAEAARRDAEGRLARAELETLKAQLRPHFLFNTLNTIIGLADVDPDSTRRVVEGLSNLLRASINSAGTQEVTVERELEVLESYVIIQEIRFSGRLRISIDYDEEVREAIVPILLIQPLVENAIQHGVTARAGSGEVIVLVERDASDLVIRVIDDGIGFDECEPVREGIGLGNTRARLSALYGASASIALENRPPRGVEVIVRLPYRLDQARSLPPTARFITT